MPPYISNHRLGGKVSPGRPGTAVVGRLIQTLIMRSEQAEQKPAEMLSAAYKIVSGKLSALKLFISAAGVLISPRWLTQLLACESQLVLCSDKAPCVFEGGAASDSSKRADARLCFCGVLAKAWQLERFDARLVSLWSASEVLNLGLNSDIDYIFHLLQACHLGHLFIFLFSGSTSRENTEGAFLKASLVMTRTFQGTSAGGSALSVPLPQKFWRGTMGGSSRRSFEVGPGLEERSKSKIQDVGGVGSFCGSEGVALPCVSPNSWGLVGNLGCSLAYRHIIQSLPSSQLDVLPVRVSVSVQLSPFSKDTSHIRLGDPILIASS